MKIKKLVLTILISLFLNVTIVRVFESRSCGKVFGQKGKLVFAPRATAKNTFALPIRRNKMENAVIKVEINK